MQIKLCVPHVFKAGPIDPIEFSHVHGRPLGETLSRVLRCSRARSGSNPVDAVGDAGRVVKRRSLPRMVGYALATVVFAGVVTRLVWRDSDADRWLIGVGGSLLFLIGVWQTAQAVLMLWRSWQLRLFGEDAWAVLTDKQGRYNAESITFWTAQVQGPEFTCTIDNGPWDPGRVGERVLVRRHVPSGQTELQPRPAPVGTLIRDIVGPFALVGVAAAFTGIGFGVLWALDLLR